VICSSPIDPCGSTGQLSEASPDLLHSPQVRGPADPAQVVVVRPGQRRGDRGRVVRGRPTHDGLGELVHRKARRPVPEHPVHRPRVAHHSAMMPMSSPTTPRTGAVRLDSTRPRGPAWAYDFDRSPAPSSVSLLDGKLNGVLMHVADMRRFIADIPASMNPETGFLD
jgi:hypothetical protein